MKAERRHELQQNELARMLMESREFFNKYGAYVAGGLLVVVVILVGGAIWRNSWQNRRLQSWNDFAEMRREAGRVLTADAPADPMELVNRFRSLSTSDQLSLRLEALQEAGNFAWQFAVGFDRARDAAEKAALLDTAAEIYEQIAREHSLNVLAVGRAQLALATIREEQGRFDDAKRIYEAILADQRFASTYVHARADEALERLPRILQPIVFAPPPPPPVEAPASAPATQAAPPTAEAPAPVEPPAAPTDAAPTDTAPTAAPAPAPSDAPAEPQSEPEPPAPDAAPDPAPSATGDPAPATADPPPAATGDGQ